MAIFTKNILRHLVTIPLGGKNATNDLAKLKNLEIEEAEKLKISYGTAWIYAVKKVNSTLYTFQNICRCTNSHQVCWFIYRKIRHCLIQNMIHFLMGFSDRKSSDCISIQIKFGDSFCMVDSDIRINCSLVNTKKQLVFVDCILKAV